MLTITTPEDGAKTCSSPTIAGTAPPGSLVSVTITDNGAWVELTATADEAGNWSVAVDKSLKKGRYLVTATTTTEEGEGTTRSSFEVEKTADKMKKQVEAVGVGAEAAGKIIEGLTSDDYSDAAKAMSKATGALGTHLGGVNKTVGKAVELLAKSEGAAMNAYKAGSKAKKAVKTGRERRKEREWTAVESELDGALARAEQALGLEPKRVTFGFEVGEEADLPTLVVSSFTLDENMDSPYRAEISLIAPRRANEDPQFERLVGRSVALVLERDELQRKVYGIVERVTFGRSNEREWYVDVVVVPALALLGYGKNRRIFQSQSIPDVLQFVLGMRLATLGREVHMDVEEDAYPIHETITQFDESDLAFCQRLMCEAGIAYWFAPNPELEAEELMLTDRNEAFAQVPTLATPGELPYEQRRSSDVRVAEPMYVLEERRELSTTVVSIGDVQWTDGAGPAASDPGQPHPLARGRQLGLAFVLTEDDSVPAQSDASMETYVFGERGPFTPDGDVYEPREEALDLYTQAATLPRYGFRAESVAVGSAPGHVFDLTGHPREELNDRYLVLGVRHRGRREPIGALEGTFLEGALTAEYGNELRCIRAEHVYRPPTHELARLRPSAPPLQSATIIGASADDAEEVVTDVHGRVRVAFAWDRGPQIGSGATAWLRVAQSWAGKGYGAWFLPRVGDSVLVSYLDGDVDRPIVIGCVHDEHAKAPWSDPSVQANKTRSGILTRTSPNGNGYNELSFEDAENNEEIRLHAQRDLNERVRGSHTTRVDGAQTLTVGGKQTTTVRGEAELTIEKDYEVNVTGNQTVTTDGDQSTEAKSLRVVANGSYTVDIPSGKGGDGAYSVVADDTVTVRAENEIRLVCGESIVSITKDQIKIRSGHSEIDVTAIICAVSSGGSYLRLDDAATVSDKGNEATLVLDSGAATVTGKSEATMGAGSGSVVANAGGVVVGGNTVKLNC